MTNTPAPSAYLALEDFKADTLVDIAPYTPRNWLPDYGAHTFSTTKDTTGFYFSKTDTALVYKHKPGAVYPVTCKLAPYSNLQWRDYEFSGMIVKPEAAVYDSVIVGMDVYSNSGNQYRFTFRNDTMWVSGGGISPNPSIRTLGNNFGHGDSLYFKITAITAEKTIGTVTYQDSTIYLAAEIGINTPTLTGIFSNKSSGGDVSSSHIKIGFPALYIDLSSTESIAADAIKIRDIKVQKVH